MCVLVVPEACTIASKPILLAQFQHIRQPTTPCQHDGQSPLLQMAIPLSGADPTPEDLIQALCLDNVNSQASAALAASPPREEPQQDLPENWPAGIKYLTDMTYSTAVTADQRDALSRKTTESETYQRISAKLLEYPSPIVSIKEITLETHPAKGQKGLFAATALEPDRFVCLYLGHVHNNSLSDTDPHSDYDLSLDRELGLSVDAGKSGNEARAANDYRGIRDRPNAEFRDCLIKVASEKRAGGTKWERRCGIFVLSAGKAGKRKAGIAAGEEIVVSYGKGFWEARKTVATFRKDEEMLRIANAALGE